MNKAIFFLGKGGVGKSTLSSAAAYRMSSQCSVLHISLDPAHNLGDIYGMTLSDRKTNVRPNLDVIEVDLAVWIERYLKWSEEEIRRQYLYDVTINLESFFNVLKYSPGTEEYAVLWAIENIYKDYHDKYDVLVFDTPPTALSMRFFAMPTISMRWIEGLASMREKILTKRQTLLRLNPESPAVRGAVKKEDDQVSLKLSSLNSRLSFMYELFTKKSFITVVVNDDKLSFSESQRIGDELRKLDIPVRAVCLNKISCTDPEERGGDLKGIFPGTPVFPTELVASGVNKVEDLKLVNVEALVNQYLEDGTKERSA